MHSGRLTVLECKIVIVCCDNLGLVLLIYLSWELIRVVYTVLYTSHPDLVHLLFVPALYSNL